MDKIQLEVQFKLLIESIQDYAIFLMDTNGYILTWNAGAVRIKGYQAEEIIGKHFSIFYPEEDRQQIPTQTLVTAEKLGNFESEEWRIRKNGSKFWASISITALRNQQGNLIGFSKITRDLTERHQAEEQFRLATESAPNGIVMVNEQGNIILVNSQTEKMFGYTRSELLGSSIELLVPKRLHTQHAMYRRDFISDPQARPMGVGRDLFGLRKDGSEFPIEIGLNPIKTEQGNLVLSTIVDITERKRAEERFRLVVESAPNGITMVDTTGKIILVNTQTEKMFGYSRSELLGESIEMLVPKRFRDTHPANRTYFMVAPQTRPMGAGRDLFGLRKDGSEFPVEIGLNPIQTDQGTMVLSTIVDITERQRAEQERDQLLASEQTARAEAELANRLKDEFLATVSHELRTPLTAILGWAHLLGSDKLNQNDFSQAIKTIQRNAKLQAQIIDDLLDISRIITGKLKIDAKLVDLLPVINSAIEIIKPAVDAKELKFRISIDSTLGPVFGDPNRIQQIIWNLLSNAVKFTPKGGRIELSCENFRAHVEIVVTDTGKGISPDFLPYVFDRFRQADSSITRQHGGLGLGLAIVRQLVELHGGTVQAHSAGEGKGATFIVKLPLLGTSIKTDVLEQTTASSEKLSALEPTLHGTRVLIVDDEPETLAMLAIIVQHTGAEVKVASSAIEALEILNRWLPDILISDIGMPITNGYDLIRQIRALPLAQGGDLPAIALTAYARDAERKQSLEAGYQQHVAKPIEPQALINTLASILDKIRRK
ncbi:MAG: PAS domain S-box protein [Acidobacteriota bacterium]